MKITPCDNTAEEVPFNNNNNKKRSKFNIFDKKKECAKGRLVVFSVIQVPGLCLLQHFTCALRRLRSLSFFCMEIISWFNLTGDLLWKV